VRAAIATLVLVCIVAAPARAREGGAAAIDHWLSTLYPAGEPGAAVIVKRGRDVILRKGYGTANLEWGVPISPQTVFRLASITKQFTAVAVLMLVQDGRIALADPVSKYLPDVHEPATIEQLLTHTSGLRSLARAPGFPLWLKVELSPREVVGLFQDQPRAFAPGQGWEYSDAGYIELGLLIEAVSGTSYEAFVRERIFEPLGMNGSHYDSGVDVIPQRASGYTKGARGFDNAAARSMSVPFSSGALASTIDDLARWDEALYGERLVGGDLLARAFTPYVLADGTPTSYGYGWLVEQLDGETVLQHGGRINGFEAHIIRVPARRIFIAVLSNVVGRDPAPDFVAARLLREIEGAADERPVSLSLAEKQQHVGVYRFGEGVDYEVRLDGDRLMLRRDSGEQREFVALGGERFRFTTAYTEVQFERVGGVVTAMSVKTPYDQAHRGVRLQPGDDVSR
jgi:CubicO group peptidase (beta-lactamase class C family)